MGHEWITKQANWAKSQETGLLGQSLYLRSLLTFYVQREMQNYHKEAENNPEGMKNKQQSDTKA